MAPWLAKKEQEIAEISLNGGGAAGRDAALRRKSSVWAGAGGDERIIIPSRIFERQRLEVSCCCGI